MFFLNLYTLVSPLGAPHFISHFSRKKTMLGHMDIVFGNRSCALFKLCIFGLFFKSTIGNCVL